LHFFEVKSKAGISIMQKEMRARKNIDLGSAKFIIARTEEAAKSVVYDLLLIDFINNNKLKGISDLTRINVGKASPIILYG